MESLKQAGKFLDSIPGLCLLVVVLALLLAAVRPLLKKWLGKEYLGQGLVITAIFLCNLVFLGLSFWFPAKGDVPASFMPRLWIIGIIACCFYIFQRMVKKTDDPDAQNVNLSLPLKFIGITVSYLILMVLIGYYIASILFIIATLLLLGYHRWIVIVAVSCGWVAFAYGIFFKILFVPLPEGMLIRMILG